MACRIVSAPAGTVRHLIAAVLLIAVTASGAAAQTLTDPAPKWSPPSKAAKSQAAQAKACRSFGPGFVNVPGTDACVRVGGWVTVEGAGRH